MPEVGESVDAERNKRAKVRVKKGGLWSTDFQWMPLLGIVTLLAGFACHLGVLNMPSPP